MMNSSFNAIGRMLAQMVLLFVAGACLTGCSEEPLDFSERPVGDMGPNGGQPEASVFDADAPEPDATQTPLTDFWPDREVFVDTVLPRLITCAGGTGCHLDPVNRTRDGFPTFLVFGSSLDMISEEDIDRTMAQFNPDVLDERPRGGQASNRPFVNRENPADSDILVHHPDKPLVGSETHRLILEWIEDALIPPPDVEGPGHEEACEDLPAAEGFGPPGWYEAFAEQGIHEVLAGTDAFPGGRCASSGCHGVANVGGRLHLRPAGEACSNRWNFIALQGFIDRQAPRQSAILVKPLGQEPSNPNQGEHGGAVVFQGTNDAAYIRLQNWIIEGQ